MSSEIKQRCFTLNNHHEFDFWRSPLGLCWCYTLSTYLTVCFCVCEISRGSSDCAVLYVSIKTQSRVQLRLCVKKTSFIVSKREFHLQDTPCRQVCVWVLVSKSDSSSSVLQHSGINKRQLFFWHSKCYPGTVQVRFSRVSINQSFLSAVLPKVDYHI